VSVRLGTQAPTTRERLVLLALLLWFVWRGLAGASAFGHACAGLDLAQLRAAACAPLAQRIDTTLGPFGVEVRAQLERLTPSDATVYVAAAEVRPAVHRLWACLFALCFPRVVLPLVPGRTHLSAPCFVVRLAPAEGEPGIGGARLVASGARWELWFVAR